MASIMVRSRVRSCNDNEDGSPRFYTEWSETTASWKKAWAIVDDCADRGECHKWRLGEDSDFYFLDIGGTAEMAAQREWFRAFMERMGVTDAV